MSKYIEGTRKLGRVSKTADPTVVGRRRILPTAAIQLERPKRRAPTKTAQRQGDATLPDSAVDAFVNLLFKLDDLETAKTHQKPARASKRKTTR